MALGIAWLLLAAFAANLRYRNGTLLTVSGGLHLNVLFFFGVGSIAYAVTEGIAEGRPRAEVLQALVVAGFPVLLGYSAVVLWEWFSRRWRGPVASVPLNVPRITRHSAPAILALWALSIVGYASSDLDQALRVPDRRPRAG
jgi:hypothetical protein